MNETLAEQLSGALQDHPEIVKKVSHSKIASATLIAEVDSEGIRITSKDPENVNSMFRSLGLLYQCILHQVKQVCGDGKLWTVRYASQITEQDFPFLVEHSAHLAAFDPMAPYRSPIRALASGETIYMVIVKAKITYSKKRDQVPKLKGKQNERNRDPRKEGAPSPKPEGKHRDHPNKGNGSSQPYRPPELDSDEDASTGGAPTSVQSKDNG